MRHDQTRPAGTGTRFTKEQSDIATCALNAMHSLDKTYTGETIPNREAYLRSLREFELAQRDLYEMREIYPRDVAAAFVAHIISAGYASALKAYEANFDEDGEPLTATEESTSTTDDDTDKPE